jgi:hypothetical protein
MPATTLLGPSTAALLIARSDDVALLMVDMSLLTTFRALLADRRRGLARVLVIMTLVFGVGLVHATSVANTHAAPVVAVADHHTDSAETAGHASAAHSHGLTIAEESGGDCSPGCGSHHDAATLCLMVLVALLAVVVPHRAAVMRLVPVWAFMARWALPAAPVGTAPSLHALGISRT